MSGPLQLYRGARPCIHCGYCCRSAPCRFGVMTSPTDARCAYLTTDNKCGIYENIVARPQSEWEWAPAFGAGCGSSLNPDRIVKGKRL